MATQEVETLTSSADKAKLAGAVLLLIAAFVAYYLLEKQGSWVQWSALLVCVVAAVGTFSVSEYGKQLLGFFQESTRELKKVVWPERKEAIQMTLYVFGFVFIMSLFLWITDKTIEWVFYDLILGWRK